MRVALLALLLLCGCPEGVNQQQMTTCKEMCAPRGVKECAYYRCVCGELK